MIRITQNVALKTITKSDSKDLYTLMKEIYPSAYQHFWKDNGDWYVNALYSQIRILKNWPNRQNS